MINDHGKVRTARFYKYHVQEKLQQPKTYNLLFETIYELLESKNAFIIGNSWINIIYMFACVWYLAHFFFLDAST